MDGFHTKYLSMILLKSIKELLLNIQYAVFSVANSYPFVNFVMGNLDFGHCLKTLVLIDFFVQKLQSWFVATLQNLQFLGIHFYASSWKYHINFALMNFPRKFIPFYLPEDMMFSILFK